jgi:hypothetical protein
MVENHGETAGPFEVVTVAGEPLNLAAELLNDRPDPGNVTKLAAWNPATGGWRGRLVHVAAHRRHVPREGRRDLPRSPGSKRGTALPRHTPGCRDNPAAPRRQAGQGLDLIEPNTPVRRFWLSVFFDTQ